MSTIIITYKYVKQQLNHNFKCNSFYLTRDLDSSNNFNVFPNKFIFGLLKTNSPPA